MRTRVNRPRQISSCWGGPLHTWKVREEKNEVVTYMQEVQAQFLLEFLGLLSNIEWRKSTLKYDGILLLKGMRHLFQEIRKGEIFTASSDHLKLEPENTRVLPSSGKSTESCGNPAVETHLLQSRPQATTEPRGLQHSDDDTWSFASST